MSGGGRNDAVRGAAGGGSAAAPAGSRPEKVRNVVLVGHSGAGKTTLVEALALTTGAVGRAGRVEDGDSLSDHDEIEQRRQRSVQLSLVPVEWAGIKVNVLDTPGYADFVGELRAGLRAADAALFVVSAAQDGEGVGGATRMVWDECAAVGMPRAVVVTHLESARAGFEETAARCAAELGGDDPDALLPLYLPVHGPAGPDGHAPVTGLAGLLTGRVYDYSSGERVAADPDPDLAPRLARARDRLIEGIIAESEDETLMDRYLGGERIDVATLVTDLERAVARGTFHPVLAAAPAPPDARQGLGTVELLELVTGGFPTPLERAAPPVTDPEGRPRPALVCDPDGPLAAEVVRTTSDPYVGRISLVRVFSGTLRPDETVHVSGHADESADRTADGTPDGTGRLGGQVAGPVEAQGTGPGDGPAPDHRDPHAPGPSAGPGGDDRESPFGRHPHDVDERVGALSSPFGKHQRPVPSAVAGDLVCVAKLTRAETGDTLSGPDRPLLMAPWPMPDPLLPVAVEAHGKADEDKLSQGLSRLVAEDPTMRLEQNPDTHQVVLWCMGEAHADVALERLRSRYGVRVDAVAHKVPLRETFGQPASARGRHVKQSGGHGQFAICEIEVEPLPVGSGIEFVDRVIGGAVPRQFVPSVEKGIRAQAARGVVLGFPVVDIRVTLSDGKAHSVDSSDAAFQTAGALALREAAADCPIRLLEPVDEVGVLVPDAYVGPVMSDLSGRRGRVLGSEPAGPGRSVVRAEVPEIEIGRYAVDLRSLSHGTGRFSRHYARHEPMPAQLAAKMRHLEQEEQQAAHTG